MSFTMILGRVIVPGIALVLAAALAWKAVRPESSRVAPRPGRSLARAGAIA